MARLAVVLLSLVVVAWICLRYGGVDKVMFLSADLAIVSFRTELAQVWGVQASRGNGDDVLAEGTALAERLVAGGDVGQREDAAHDRAERGVGNVSG
jgi:hypothetical protein